MNGPQKSWEDELGPLRERFDVGKADQRSLAVARGAAALLGGGCALLLLLSRVPIPVFMAALLGLLMSLVWWRQARRALETADSAETHYLAIHAQGFVVSEGQTITVARFSDISDIQVDEERLDIVVDFKDRGPLRLEARYPGVAIHELVRRLQSAAHAGSHLVRGG